MEERPPRQPSHRHGGAASRRRSRAFRRTRAVIIALCAAALAVAVGAGVHSAALARPTAAAQLGSVTDSQAPSSNVQAPAAFVAASTAKVLAAEAYYHLVETGKASLDDPLGADTAEFQLQAMIQQSDNDSWSLIMDAVGHAELTDYAASIGVDYAPTSNTLTPAEMARILAGLYSGTLLDPGHTAQLLSFLQDTNYETLIPAAVPAGITVFHKYGLPGGQLHDAGILARDGRAYALVVYAKGAGLGSVPERSDVVHQVTTAVVEALF